jgi:hypothetical protein
VFLSVQEDKNMEIGDEDGEPESLHYYCSSSTFLSIIKNRALWLTAVSLSNDRMEGYWAIERYLALLKHDDTRGVMGARSFLKMAVNSRIALGLCFSRERDLLSQWRGYASGGKGLCITFKVSHLKASIECLRASLSKLNLCRIEYLSNLDPETVKAVHEEFGSQIAQARSGRDGDFITMRKDYSNGGHDRETKTVARFFAVKNPAFKEEREWRFLLVDYPSSIPDLKFRESSSLISPYVEIPIELDAISSVTLGPLHPTPTRDVERMLSTFGMNLNVRSSAASYVVR